MLILRTTTSPKGGCSYGKPPTSGRNYSARIALVRPVKLWVTEAAKGLGVSRRSLSELLNGRNGISADMALRLERPVGARRNLGCAIS